ncbi:MAG: GIY-YIG nuclease family protein [Candidatus Nanopelagicales bacterium]
MSGTRGDFLIEFRHSGYVLIHAYGMFWDADDVDWNASWPLEDGYKSAFRLLGSRGVIKLKIRVADFRKARVVYVLHDDFGVYYVGLASSAGGIRKRLRDHRSDGHKSKWKRFSWFAFDGVTSRVDKETGLTILKSVQTSGKLTMSSMISDLDALLIELTGAKGNKNLGHFDRAEKWDQVRLYEVVEKLHKVAP